MKRILLFVLALGIAGGLIIGGVSLLLRADQEDFSAVLDGKPYVVATIFPVYDIAQNIAGDDVNVQLLLPAGASPHTFEIDPRTANTFEKADIVFAIGHGIDDWATQLAGEDELVIVDKNIPLLETKEQGIGEDEHEEDEHADEVHTIDDGHEHGPTDPHYWLSGENGKIIAQTIADRLKSAYPQYAANFDARLRTYLVELQAAHETTHTIINEVGNKRIVTLHDAWYYFADAYGLEIVATYTPSAGKDPLPQDIAALAKVIRENQIQTMYLERQTSSASLEAFLEDQNLLIAKLDEIGGLPDTSSYIDLLLYNANVFASQP